MLVKEKIQFLSARCLKISGELDTLVFSTDNKSFKHCHEFKNKWHKIFWWFELTSLVEDLCKEYTAVLAISKAVFRNAISVPVKSRKNCYQNRRLKEYWGFGNIFFWTPK